MISIFYKILKSLLNRWTLFALLIAVFSLFLHFRQASILTFSIPIFLFGTLFSICIWNALGNLIQFFPKKIGLVFVAVVSLIMPLTFAIAVTAFMEFNVFLDKNLLLFVFEDPEYFANLLSVFFSNLLTAIAYLSGVLILFFYFSFRLDFGQRNYLQTIIFLIITIVGQNQFGKFGHEYFHSIDSSMIFASKKFFREKDEIIENKKHLKPSKDRIQPQPGTSSDYNIVLILQESMSQEPLSLFGFENNYTPFMQSWFDKEKNQFVLFNDAMAISGCTDVSVPTLFTGVGPEESFEKIMKMPFMWDYAKANGYSTAIMSSQRYTWNNLRYFIKNQSLDILYTSEDSDLKTVNDLGVDDIAMTSKLKEQLENLPENQPVFFIYNSNALHFPFQNSSSYVEIPKEITKRYGRSLYIIDKSIENIYNVFKKRGELDKTIFIFTADHGEYTQKRMSRLGSFFKEALQIPVYIRFPQKWIEENQEKFAQINSNSSKRITNMELMPTLVDLLGSRKSNSEIYSQYGGSSLFDKIENSRMLVFLSTNEYRFWSNEGLGIYQDSLSYIIDNINNTQLYNLITDSLQKENIIDKLPQNYKDEFLQRIKSNKELSRIYDNYSK